MFAAFWISLFGLLFFWINLLRNVPAAGWSKVWLRLPLYVLIGVLATLMNLFHWLGFLLDEIFFRRYRQVAIERPVFVVGVPRSGTTFLQRLLAEDKQFTSFTTWQCLFAPSISQRKILQRLARWSRPFGGSLKKLEQGLFRKMENVHRIRLDEPEEDFLLLWPLQACFLLALLCPRTAHYWNLGHFDQKLPAWYRSAVMKFYRRCVQKHLYCEGEDHRFLSKNPSFTPLMDSLTRTFADARLVLCCRAPREVIPSQLSSLTPGMKTLGYADMSASVQTRLLNVLEHYYRETVKQLQQGAALPVEMHQLGQDLPGQMARLYGYLEIPMDKSTADRILARSRQTRYQSGHQYDLAQFNLSEASVDAQFGALWQQISEFNRL